MSFPQELKKTVAGIAIDPQTLERVVPVTRRKDGSERKELKIRPGFTPQEDVVKYKTTGQKESSRLKGYIPGASSASSSTYQALPKLSDFPPIGGLTQAQRKNQRRKAKKVEEKNARNWDSDSGDEPSGSTGGKKEEVVEPEQPKKPVRQAKSALSGIVDTLQALKVADPLPSPYAIPAPSAPTESPSSIPSPAPAATPAPTITPSSTPAPKKGPRPGGGLFRDLSVKAKSPSPAASPAPSSAPAKAQPATRTPAAPRQRPEVRVRPGGGLAGLNGLVRSMAAEREAGK